MAVDTRNRRASCYLPGMPWRNIGPDPDGDITPAADRVQMAWLYPGITPSVQSLVSNYSGSVGLRPLYAGRVKLLEYMAGKARLRG